MSKPDIRDYKETADKPPKNKELLEIHKQWEIECVSLKGVKLRAGYFPSKIDPPKANILYLEGLADSMFNHDRLINTLSKAGYRTIAFDYPGQGGSEGSMDQTLITENKISLKSIQERFKSDHKKNVDFNKFIDALGLKKHTSMSSHPHPQLLIKEMADEIWKEIKKSNKIDSKEQIDAVIGWSTGGLAAYDMARKKKKGVRAVVLIAPGTNTKFVKKIETKTLNGDENFKHLDNIRPDSPLKVPRFTANLLASGHSSQDWKVENDVKGLVLLSGPKKDSYVCSEEVGRTLERNAGHFEVEKYDNAAHEIDNESDKHRSDKEGVKLEDRVVDFFNRVLD